MLGEDSGFLDGVLFEVEGGGLAWRWRKEEREWREWERVWCFDFGFVVGGGGVGFEGVVVG